MSTSLTRAEEHPLASPARTNLLLMVIIERLVALTEAVTSLQAAPTAPRGRRAAKATAQPQKALEEPSDA